MTKLKGSTVEFIPSPGEQNEVRYPAETKITGGTVELELNDEEKKVNVKTKIFGFTVELVDYPFYSSQIYVRRFLKGTFT